MGGGPPGQGKDDKDKKVRFDAMTFKVIYLQVVTRRINQSTNLLHNQQLESAEGNASKLVRTQQQSSLPSILPQDVN